MLSTNSVSRELLTTCRLLRVIAYTATSSTLFRQSYCGDQKFALHHNFKWHHQWISSENRSFEQPRGKLNQNKIMLILFLNILEIIRLEPSDNNNNQRWFLLQLTSSFESSFVQIRQSLVKRKEVTPHYDIVRLHLSQLT